VSYYVQKLFSEFQGVRYIETSVKTGDSDPHDHGIAASATCQDNDCTQLAFKVMQPLPVYVHYTVQLLKSVTLFMSCVVPTLTCMTAADFQFRLPVAVLILASPPFTLCSWVAPVLFLFRHIHPAHPFSAPPPPLHISSQPAFVQLNLLLLSFLPSFKHSVPCEQELM